jgi:CHRD domain
MTRHRRLFVIAATVGAAVAITATGSVAAPEGVDTFGRNNVFRVQLSGYQEDPLAFSTPASGSFRAVINERAQEITYSLSYNNLSGGVTQAHIHFGGRHQGGGISIFLCTNAGNGPAGTQLCPAAPATITGTIKPDAVIGPVGQGIAAGEFAEIVKAMRAGMTYANVHSVERPAGEVRGQLDHNH